MGFLLIIFYFAKLRIIFELKKKIFFKVPDRIPNRPRDYTAKFF